MSKFKKNLSKKGRSPASGSKAYRAIKSMSHRILDPDEAESLAAKSHYADYDGNYTEGDYNHEAKKRQPLTQDQRRRKVDGLTYQEEMHMNKTGKLIPKRSDKAYGKVYDQWLKYQK